MAYRYGMGAECVDVDAGMLLLLRFVVCVLCCGRFGKSVRSLWHALATNGTLPSSMPTINSATGFPSDYNTLEVDTQISSAKNLRVERCAGLKHVGLGHDYWWVN